MSEYKLVEKDRAEVVRRQRRIVILQKQLEAYLNELAERLGVPWSSPRFDMETGQFNAPLQSPQPIILKKPEPKKKE